MHPRFAPFFQAFEPDELADITLDTIVFYVKGRVEGVPLYGVSGALGSVLNTKYIVKHRVQSGMLDKVDVEPQQHYCCCYYFFSPANSTTTTKTHDILNPSYKQYYVHKLKRLKEVN